MLEILDVVPLSIAAELGLRAGDRLSAIDGRAVRDLVDYHVADDRDTLTLEIIRADGEIWEFDIEKDADESVGLVLPHPEPLHCGNQCVFCFVHQLPRGMRKSLYVKDEDYRFSYLYGAYVTLSNLAEADLDRILEQRLSPLYVSVHATDETVRTRLLGRPAPPLMPLLRQLVNGGIALHTQIVICPGINDDLSLEKTFEDLVGLAPGVRSLALVPVGLTEHRDRLPRLRTVSQTEARQLVTWVHDRQRHCLATLGSRFLFAADELYLKAGLDVPGIEHYEDLPQIENGVGMIAQFRAQARQVLEHVVPLKLPPLLLVTGIDAADEIETFIRTLNSAAGLSIRVVPVRNEFFGGNVTVAGLLTGHDILEQVPTLKPGDILLLPDVLLREGENVLLDDVTVDELEAKLGGRIEVFSSNPDGLWDLLDTLHLEFNTEEEPS